jgi:hypothetical protein
MPILRRLVDGLGKPAADVIDIKLALDGKKFFLPEFPDYHAQQNICQTQHDNKGEKHLLLLVTMLKE